MRIPKTVSLLLFMLPTLVQAQLTITAESGLVFNPSNDVRVPNGMENRGTFFSLSDDFAPALPGPFFRIEARYLLNEKHTFELTAAPLAANYTEYTGGPLSFAGTLFTGEGIEGRYEFNTYRASYRYRLLNRPQFKLDVGATALIRDARIAVLQNGTEAEDTDLGFVPLLSLHLQYLPADRWTVQLKGDALVGPVGRAEDVFAGLTYALLKNQTLRLKAGYRIVEGGADIAQVYNFALLHFADVGLEYTLGK